MTVGDFQLCSLYSALHLLASDSLSATVRKGHDNK